MFFSRIGIPYEMLTDQGSVFMGPHHRILWVLNIDPLRKFPYHIQMDGCLECWHGSMKHMLHKCEDRKAQCNVFFLNHSRTYLVNC